PMSIDHVPCGPFANESERKALECLLAQLRDLRSGVRWVLLTNLAHAFNVQQQADEVDLIAIGPTGDITLHASGLTSIWSSITREPGQVTKGGRQMSAADTLASAAPDLMMGWHAIDWAAVPRHVRRLQPRIVKAVQELTASHEGRS